MVTPEGSLHIYLVAGCDVRGILIAGNDVWLWEMSSYTVLYLCYVSFDITGRELPNDVSHVQAST